MDKTETETKGRGAACQRLLDSPVIAAVKDEAGLDAALQSECGAVFLLFGSAAEVGRLVRRTRDAGKLAIVHIDLVEGLSCREAAVDTLAALCRPDGIISTRPPLVRRGRHMGQLNVGKPDFIEILPGIIPRVIGEVAAATSTPVIAGGLIRYKDEVMAAMRAGAAAVSTSSPPVWDM